jgi:hypothetical protein
LQLPLPHTEVEKSDIRDIRAEILLLFCSPNHFQYSCLPVGLSRHSRENRVWPYGLRSAWNLFPANDQCAAFQLAGQLKLFIRPVESDSH